MLGQGLASGRGGMWIMQILCLGWLRALQVGMVAAIAAMGAIAAVRTVGAATVENSSAFSG
jgi:hypothetical protein